MAREDVTYFDVILKLRYLLKEVFVMELLRSIRSPLNNESERSRDFILSKRPISDGIVPLIFVLDK
jgi:hypothetical protein